MYTQEDNKSITINNWFNNKLSLYPYAFRKNISFFNLITARNNIKLDNETYKISNNKEGSNSHTLLNVKDDTIVSQTGGVLNWNSINKTYEITTYLNSYKDINIVYFVKDSDDNLIVKATNKNVYIKANISLDNT